MAAINFQTEVDIIVNVLRWRTDLVVTMPNYENFSFQVRCGEGAHKKLSILQFMNETVFCVSVRVIQEDFNVQYVASDIMTAFGGLIALLKEYPGIKKSVVNDLSNLNQHFTVQEVKEPAKVSPPQQLVTSTGELYNFVSVADAGKCKVNRLWDDLASLFITRFKIHKHSEKPYTLYIVDEAGIPDIAIEFTVGATEPWSISAYGMVWCGKSLHGAFHEFAYGTKTNVIGGMTHVDACNISDSDEYRRFMAASVADTSTCKEPVVVATDGSVVALLTEKDWELYSTGNSYTLEDLSLDWVSVPSDGVEVRELPIPDDCYVTKIFAQ